MKKGIIFLILSGWFTGGTWAQGLDQRYQRIPVQDSLKKSLPQFRSADKPTSIRYDYYQSLGAACKVELKLEKATKVPFRFRLGSLQQTDYMEQKANAQKP